MMRIYLLLVLGALGVGCTASADEVRPPKDQFFFPTGLVMAPDQDSVFVANANSELRYDSGAVHVVAVSRLAQAVMTWVDTSTLDTGCQRDVSLPHVMLCDEAPYINAEAGVRVGNFASAVAMQDFGAAGFRLHVPVRGDPSHTWIDGSAAGLSCNATPGAFQLCDDAHRLIAMRNDEAIGVLTEEPFGVYADAAGGFAAIAHLDLGAVSLVDSRAGVPAQLTDSQLGVFASDSFGNRGATSVAARPTTTGEQLVYAAARTEDRIQLFTVARSPADGLPTLLNAGHFFLNGVGGNNGGSSDTRALVFAPDGKRLFVLNRRPPSVQMYDTQLGSAGFPLNRFLSSADVCTSASQLLLAGVGEALRAYVTCFADGTMLVIDPVRGHLERVVSIGRGPFAMSYSDKHQMMLLTNHLEDTLSVVDFRPTSKAFGQVVMRVGVPRQ